MFMQFYIICKSLAIIKPQRHGNTEKKDEGRRMMDEKEETSIIVSAFITHPSSFPVLSVPLCLRV
jgi:hypothetical protein